MYAYNKICARCKFNLTKIENANFCPGCGQKLHKQTAGLPAGYWWDVARVISLFYGVPARVILSREQTSKAVIPRHFFCLALRQKYNLTYQQIGFILCRHHSTIMASVKQAEYLLNRYTSVYGPAYNASSNILKKNYSYGF